MSMNRSSDSCYGCGDPRTWTLIMYICDHCKQKDYDPSKAHRAAKKDTLKRAAWNR